MQLGLCQITASFMSRGGPNDIHPPDARPPEMGDSVKPPYDIAAISIKSNRTIGSDEPHRFVHRHSALCCRVLDRWKHLVQRYEAAHLEYAQNAIVNLSQKNVTLSRTNAFRGR